MSEAGLTTLRTLCPLLEQVQVVFKTRCVAPKHGLPWVI